MANPKWNKARGMWVLQAKHNGMRKTFYSSVKGVSGKREVLSKYNDWLDFGGVTDISVSKCIELYLKDIESRLGRKTSYIRTESYSRLYIVPTLGKAKMNKLSLREWQGVISNARPQKRGVKSLSYKTLCNLREVISGLHRFAYNNYFCDAWRGELYIPQGHKKGEKEILQPNEIKRLFEDSDIWYLSAIQVMLLCGLRPSECLGLQVSDIGEGVLYVRRGVNTRGEITSGKTKNARRVVPMPKLAEVIIRETIERNDKARFNTKWIFCNGSGGMGSQSTMRKQWERLKEEKKLSGSLYSLRHTFVSIVSSQTHLAEGTIKDIVGQGEFDTLGTYKHQVSGEIEQAADVINLTFERLKAENS